MQTVPRHDFSLLHCPLLVSFHIPNVDPCRRAKPSTVGDSMHRVGLQTARNRHQPGCLCLCLVQFIVCLHRCRTHSWKINRVLIINVIATFCFILFWKCQQRPQRCLSSLNISPAQPCLFWFWSNAFTAAHFLVWATAASTPPVDHAQHHLFTG